MKNKAIAFICVMLSFLTFATVNTYAQNIKGNGKIKTDIRQVTGFNRVVVQGQVELYLSQETTENVKIEAEENLIELFQTLVNDNTLYVIVPNNIKKSNKLTITIAFKELKNIILLNEVSLKTDRAVNFDEVEIICGGSSKMDFEYKASKSNVKVIDGGSVFLRGYSEELTIEAHDDAEINAFDLQSDNCNVVGSGYSEISVNAKKKLAITLSGSSNLFFMGEPAISQRNFNSTGLITKRKVGADK